jgi:hypothetical protein
MLPIVVAEARIEQTAFTEASDCASKSFEGGSPRLRRLAACVLAHAQLAQGKAALALRTIETALAFPTSNGLESDLDLKTLYAEALLAVGDTSAARRAAADAREAVLAIASTIESAELKQSFCENVRPCARALKLAQDLCGGST